MKNRILTVILPVVACLALLPGAQAQVCQDGCGSNFNTFQGTNALLNVGAGVGNTAFGWEALAFTSATSFNTGIGGGALALNNNNDNTAVGAGAMLLNTSGNDNTAVGTDALLNNGGGADNNAVGSFALFSNVGGSFNNALGRNALTFNLGSQNDAVGDDALDGCTTGTLNTAMGDEAGNTIIDGNNNVCIGANAGIGIVHASNQIAIGVPTVGPFADVGPTCFIGSIWDEPPSDVASNLAVFIDSNNVVNAPMSTRRVKHDIKPMDKASEAIYALKPVSFVYNSDKTGTAVFGLIAEEVAKAYPKLAVYRDGQPLAVKYDQINVMLLNEFLKEHKKVEEQQASISQLKNEMQTMVAQLKDQAAQIQKVSAQIQVNKPAPQVVVNKP